MNTDRFKHKETTNIEAGLLLNVGKKPEFKRFVYVYVRLQTKKLYCVMQLYVAICYFL